MPMDHYEVLGVAPDADVATLRAAYLRVMREHHPDHRPGDALSADTARRANAAWTVLSDASRRAAYDRLLAVRRGAAAPVAGNGHAQRVSPPGTNEQRVAAARAAAAYSREGEHFRAALHRACLKVGAAVFALGIVLLLAAAT